MKRLKNVTPFIVMDILRKARQWKDTIHMEIGEPDLEPPPGVLEAMIRAIRTKKYHYAPALGIIELREKISEYYHANYDIHVSPERIIITPGTSGAFLIALGLTLDGGERFCLSDPAYPCYKNFGYFLNTEPVFVPVNSETNFEIQVDVLKRIKPVKTLIISSPSNPTGRLYGEDNFKILIEYCDKKGIQFISDEIYHGLVYNKKVHTALEFSDKSIVINGFSKSFCMPGFRIGWMIVPEDLVRKAEIIIQNIFIASNTPAQYAACEAFDSHYLHHVTDIFRKRRDFLYSEVASLFNIPIYPDGAFYIWADVSDHIPDSLVFSRRLLDEEHVAVTPGLDFGQFNANKYIRFAYTRSIDELKEGVSRIKKFIKHI